MLQLFLPTFHNQMQHFFFVFFTIQMKKQSHALFSEHSVRSQTDTQRSAYRKYWGGGLVIYIKTILWSQTLKQ